MHSFGVVSPGQFAESRQTCSPHPNLELLVLLQIRGLIVFGVPFRVPFMPIRWRGYFVGGILRWLVQLFIGLPCNPLVGHKIGLVLIAAVAGCDQNRRRESVVEKRVRDETTGVVS